MKKKLPRRFVIICFVLIIFFVASLEGCWFFLKKNFDGVSLDAIIFTARTTSPRTADPTIVKNFFKEQLYAYLAAVVLLYILLYPSSIKTRLRFFRKQIFPLSNCMLISFAVLMLALAATHVSVNLQLSQHIANKYSVTEIYDRYYVPPERAKLNFPYMKRNLILIYMESMESTYLTYSQGGGADVFFNSKLG